ncbi:MAG: hypothetical protein ACTSXS_02405 [Candidatus Thorarchaeota archaeon]
MKREWRTWLKMDVMLLLSISAVTILMAIFNYYLNYAPGTTPDDYALGPKGASLQCDCCLNMVLIGVIAVAALAVSSSYFDSRTELYSVAIIVFVVITVAGFLGRRRRYHEWNEAYDLLQSVLPNGTVVPDEHERSYDDDFNDF